MKDSVTAIIFRFDPDLDTGPHYDTFQVKADEEMSVLVLLKRIQENLDPTLSFRNFCCGLQMCRSCLMKVNRQKKFACLTLVGPGDEVTVEPYSYPEAHIKDLVVRLEE